jgi:DNA-binding FrmR family transcriptional regulator
VRVVLGVEPLRPSGAGQRVEAALALRLLDLLLDPALERKLGGLARGHVRQATWQIPHPGIPSRDEREEPPMAPDVKRKLEARLRRIAGQVSGLERMVAEDRYCVDVLLQIAAVRAALDGAGKLLLGAHVESCVADAVASGRPRERRQKLDELREVLARFGAVGS